VDQQKTKAGQELRHAPKKVADFELPPIPDEDVVPPAFHHDAPKLSTWQRLKQWVGTHRKASIAILIVTILLLAGGGVAAYMLLHQKKTATPATTPAKAQATPTPAPTKYFSPLTGLEVPDLATTKREVTAIMIENSPSARPQSGLKEAGIVYEAIAEGGITRFATLFQEARPGLIGPVRSLRPYYLSWIAPFDAAIAHVGGSYNVLNEVRTPGKYKDIDQFFSGNYYWRATDRYAPHNVYTSFDKLDALNTSKGHTSSAFTGFPRKPDTPSAKPTANSIDITISSASYNVHYDYEAPSNSYVRSEGGQKHVDRESGWIKPKVIIAIKVPTTLGWEDGYREQMTVIGTGEAYVFQDGTVEKATWSKTGQKDQMHFLNAAGKDIKLNPGQTWITATPTNQSVTWQ
jgi:hypothetical protein